jgi:hypothetical protein
MSVARVEYGETYSNESEIAKLKQQVTLGLDLDSAGFLKIPGEVREDIVGEIALQLLDLTDYLDIPIPKIGLIREWNESIPDLLELDVPNRDVLAIASKDPLFNVEGIIKFSPAYIKSLVTHRMGIDQKPIIELTELVAHECYHLKQMAVNIDQVIVDSERIRTEGLGAWRRTVTEREARKFEKEWKLLQLNKNNPIGIFSNPSEIFAPLIAEEGSGVL